VQQELVERVHLVKDMLEALAPAALLAHIAVVAVVAQAQ
jgi:hypothetical protein